jgi:hypothetical protein
MPHDVGPAPILIVLAVIWWFMKKFPWLSFILLTVGMFYYIGYQIANQSQARPLPAPHSVPHSGPTDFGQLSLPEHLAALHGTLTIRVAKPLAHLI